MDFLDPKKRKAHTRRLFIGYGLMTVAIGLGAVILLYVALGFGVDRSGNLFQNGIVFLASSPDQAQVKISNKAKTFSETVVTSDRLNLKSDLYKFQFLKKGYRPWERTLELRGGSVERLVYPLLFPDKLNPTNKKLYDSAPGLVTQSPDMKTILVQRPGTLGTFDSFDSESPDKQTTSFKLSANLFPAGAKPEKLELVEWSKDNRHILVSYKSGKTKLFILVDRSKPSSSVNLNNLFGLSTDIVTLRDKSPESFYILLSDSRLLSAQAKNKSLSLIAKNVAAFDSFGNDTVIYVSTKNSKKTKKSDVYIKQNNTVQLLRHLPVDNGYNLGISSYNDKLFVVAGAKSDDNTYIYRDPIKAFLRKKTDTELTTRTLRLKNVDQVSFSQNSQFIAAQSAQNYDVYDAEQDRQYRYDIPDKIDSGSKAVWMDGHRMTFVSKGKLVVFDFDGINKQILVDSSSQSPAMFTPDYGQLFVVASPSSLKNKSALTQTSLIVAN